ncbi:membrane lipoprotein lipid attachment site-containing protein [Oceanobacillus sp. CFH 90083]|uniref:membrane lipoprotein lipid attachment site-containing protein n=1 Tax=Oceanobacillus sp. CFH 90083 TaxID=2592336 RepID=UPI00128D7CD6|nr:membrane lipoprotein lipid attachment site-containing protein [Oceanobacillus sp. CFH 90083]
MKKLFLFILLIFSLSACSKMETNTMESNHIESVARMPDDFDFSVQFGVGKNNEINTVEGTVTKDLIADGTVTAEMTLTEEEMKAIYEKMKEINIVETKEFTPEPVNGTMCMQEPHEEDEWKIAVNGEIIVHSVSGAYCDPTDDTKQLMELRNYVFSVVRGKEEYKVLSNARGGYE